MKTRMSFSLDEKLRRKINDIKKEERLNTMSAVIEYLIKKEMKK